MKPRPPQPGNTTTRTRRARSAGRTGATTMATVKIKMLVEKVCKGSVRYASADDTAVATNVYVSKTLADPMPQEILLTIETPSQT